MVDNISFIKDTFFGGAEKKAAQAQERGIQAGIEEQRRQFDLNRADLAPRIEAEQSALERLLEFLGVRGAEAEQSAIDSFSESPGQAFLRKRQEKALLRNQAAIGGLGGGNVRTALQEQANDIASTQLGDRLNRLAGVASGNTVVSGAQLGANSAANIAGLQRDAGTARATGIRGSAAGMRSGLARVAGAFI